MSDNTAMFSNSPYKGCGSLTREQFLFYEMRAVARLMQTDLSEQQIMEKIVSDNIFQYPTERSIKSMARVCIKRLRSLQNETLVQAIAEKDFYTAKQICLFAMMRQYRVVWDFMITVIGSKYRQQDFTYNRSDIYAFLRRLQEQDDLVASWSEETLKKIVSVISKILVENEYIDDGKARTLNSVTICSVLEDALRSTGQEIVLPAFNCLL